MAGNEDRIEYLMASMSDARDVPADAIDAFDRSELDDLRALLADPAMWEEPRADLGDAVVASVVAAAAEAGASGTGPAAATTSRTSTPITPSPAPSSASGQAGVTPIRRAGRPRGLSMLGAAALGAAAAAAIAFAVVRVGDDDTSIRTADAQIELLGTDLLPGAAGIADIRTTPSGVEIRLDLPGLPRRDGAEFYQAWLKNTDGTGLIPIGTFHSGDDVILWAGVSIEDYPILTVTRETVAGPQDPGQGSSGEVVVSGSLVP